ncbi:uncharacterized protein LOC129716441 [Leucoraja erinacea]|uniref:uncharacterized protein LOC129716441 n=1 Tax=Leucoraja erinaceus TaxID=7782 RepID=UPI002455677B|nr:uncharacterized protein LOC129716441 [Leucoraja erinacea]
MCQSAGHCRPHLSFVERFFRTNTFDHKSIRKWSTWKVLVTLQGNVSMDPVAWFPEQTAQLVWQNVSSPQLTNKHQDLAWLAGEGSPPRQILPAPSEPHYKCALPRDGCYGEEMVAHLFAECGFAKPVWRGLQGSLSWFIPNSSVIEEDQQKQLIGLYCICIVITVPRDTFRVASSAAGRSPRRSLVCPLFTTQQSEMSIGECCRLARCRLQEYVLRDALKTGAANVKARCGRTTVSGPSDAEHGGQGVVETPFAIFCRVHQEGCEHKRSDITRQWGHSSKDLPVHGRCRRLLLGSKVGPQIDQHLRPV